MKRKRRTRAFTQAFLFFLLCCGIVTVTIFLFEAIRLKANGNVTVISVSLIAMILFISVLCTLVQLLYKKATVENNLAEIQEAADKIAHGNFNVYLTTSRRNTELDEIREDINTMARELKKNAIAGNDFISNVSHEIKTPLAIIRNSVELMDSGNLKEEEEKEYFQMLKGATERLSRLVSDVLSLNKMENNRLKPEMEHVNLEELLTDILLNYENVLDEKKLELDCDFRVTEMTSSPLYLKMIFNNLISNAVKFTDKGSISLRTSKENERVIVEVKDTGPGISKDCENHIFDKFYQGDTSHKTEGNGLGMAMVKTAILALKGEIQIESEESVGTMIRVILPESENE